MSRSNDDKVRDIIAYYRDQVDEFRSELKTNPAPDRTAEVYRYIGLDTRNIGLHYLELGEETLAIESFTMAAHEFVNELRSYREYVDAEFDQVHWENETVTLLDALYMAVLSCDDESRLTAIEAATSVAGMSAADHPANASRVNSVRGLAGLLGEVTQSAPAADFDSHDAIEEIHANLDEEEETPRAYFEALGVALGGIVDEDVETVRRGLQALLDYHESQFDGEPETISERIDVRSTAIARLAREHGLDPATESPYIADGVVTL